MTIYELFRDLSDLLEGDMRKEEMKRRKMKRRKRGTEIRYYN